VTAALSCIPATASAGANVAIGLPGPIRVVTERNVTYEQ
jgi:hypothetical protein